MHKIAARGIADFSVRPAATYSEQNLPALAPQMRWGIYANDKFTGQGLWPIPIIPLLARRKTTKVLTPSGWFAVCAASAIVMGAAIAFAT